MRYFILSLCFALLVVLLNSSFATPPPQKDPLNGALKAGNITPEQAKAFRAIANPNRAKIFDATHTHQGSFEKGVQQCFAKNYPSNMPVGNTDAHKPAELEKCILGVVEELSLATKKAAVTCECKDAKKPIQDSTNIPGDGVKDRF